MIGLPHLSMGPRYENQQTKGTLFEYLVLFWDGSRSSLYQRFGYCRRGLEDSLENLHGKGLVGFETKRSLGMFTTQRIQIPQTAPSQELISSLSPRTWDTTDELVIDTELDMLLYACHRYGGLACDELCRPLGCAPYDLSWAFETLADDGFIGLRYRGSQSRVTVKESPIRDHPKMRKPNYSIKMGQIEVPARISESQFSISVPSFSKPTSRLLCCLMDDVVPAQGAGSKASIQDAICEGLKTKLPFFSEMTRAYALVHLTNSLRLGPLEYLLADRFVTEIKAKGGSQVFVKHTMSKHEWTPTNITIAEQDLCQYAYTIAAETDQHIDASNPLMDAVLHTNDRVNISLPKTAGGNTIMEIRKFDTDPFDFIRLIRCHTISAQAMALIWLAMCMRLNIIVSGETGSGKTSFANAISLFMPRNDHIVTVEDTREIRLPQTFGNTTHLTTCRVANEMTITMDRLLLNALRMDPSHIILGEVRSKADIDALMGATAMGHPVLSTIHSRDCATTVKRFADAGISANDMRNIHLNIVLESIRHPKDPTRRLRVVKEIAQYTEAGGRIRPEIIYRMDHKSLTLRKVQDPLALYRMVSDMTGLDRAQIECDLAMRENTLSWLQRNDVRNIDILVEACEKYERDPKKMSKMLEAMA